MRRLLPALALAGIIAAGCSDPGRPFAAENAARRAELVRMCEEVRALDKAAYQAWDGSPSWSREVSELEDRRAQTAQRYNAAMETMRRVWQGGTADLPAQIDARRPDCETGDTR